MLFVSVVLTLLFRYYDTERNALLTQVSLLPDVAKSTWDSACDAMNPVSTRAHVCRGPASRQLKWSLRPSCLLSLGCSVAISLCHAARILDAEMTLCLF